MAHAVECFTSNKANPFSNLFAKEAAKLIFDNIEAACDDPEAEEAKTNMLIAAFYAGAAISSSGTTAVHALSYPLGGKSVSYTHLVADLLQRNCRNPLKETVFTGKDCQKGQPVIISEFVHTNEIERLVRICRFAGYVRMNLTSQEIEDTSPFTSLRVRRDSVSYTPLAVYKRQDAGSGPHD